MKVKYFLSPLIIIPLIFSFQFLTWLFTFGKLKNYVPGLEGVSFYLFPSPLLKYLIFFGVFYSFIWIGFLIKPAVNSKRSFIPSFIDDIRLRKSLILIAADILLLLVIISEILNFYLARNLLRNPLVLFSQGQGLVQLAYVTLQNENNFFRTFYNFLPIISGIYAFFLFNNSIFINQKEKKKIKRKISLVLIITVIRFFTAARQLAFAALLVIFALYIKYRIGFNKKIKLKYIFFILILILFIVLLSEILRFSVLNSSLKGIRLFSFQNISDVSKYLTIAYIAKNENNAMIILDSQPTYSMFSTGSRLIYILIKKFFSPLKFSSAEYLGPHGTVDFIASIWRDWGWGTPVILSIIGFFIGFTYKIYLTEFKYNFFWDILYSVVYPGIISIIRINYFFLNLFLYPLIILSNRKHYNNIYTFIRKATDS